MERLRKERVINEKKLSIKAEKSLGVEARVKQLSDDLERAPMLFEKSEDTCMVSKLRYIRMHLECCKSSLG